MFAVIFEVQPKSERWDDYLGYARLLRPELERVDGFIENIRYKSLRRPGWLLSLSIWRDEKALVRWRTHALHHEVQEKGRFEVFRDYHLRVGQITADTALAPGERPPEQRLDETERGAAKSITITELQHETGPPPEALAHTLGWREAAPSLVAWDVFDAILSPGALLLLQSWQDASAARAAIAPPGARLRQVRVIRDYGMHDRAEAPQYYPPVPISA